MAACEKILFDSRKFVLVNIPSGYNQELIKDHVEATLDTDVEDVRMYPFIFGRALVTLKDPLNGFEAVADALEKESLEDHNIKLLRTAHQDLTLFISDIDYDNLKRDSLKNYLESITTKGKEVIESIKVLSEYKIAVVRFKAKHGKAVSNFLKETEGQTTSTNKYNLKVEPFYSNFHDFIERRDNIVSSSDDGSSGSTTDSDDNTADSDDVMSESSTEEERQDKYKQNDKEDHGTSSGDESPMHQKEREIPHPIETLSKKKLHSGSKSGFAIRGTDIDAEKRFPRTKRDAAVSQQASSSDSHSQYYVWKSTDSEDAHQDKTPRKTLQGDGKESFGQSTDKQKWTSKFLNKFKKAGDSAKEKQLTKENPHLKIKPKQSQEKLEMSWSTTDSDDNTADSADVMTESSTEEERQDKYKQNDKEDHGTSSGDESPMHQKEREMPQPIENLSKKKLHSGSKSGFATRGTDIDAEKRFPRTKRDTAVSQQASSSDSHSQYYVWKSTDSEDAHQDKTPRKSLQGDGKESFGQSTDKQKSTSKFLIKLKNEKDFAKKKQLEEKLKQLTEENSCLKTKPKQSEEKLQMSALQAQFLQPHFTDHHTDCYVIYNAEEKVAVICGPEDLIKDIQLKLMLEMRNIHEESITVSPEMLSILKKEKGIQFLKDLVLKGALIDVEESAVKVASHDEDILANAVDMLKLRLDEKKTFPFSVEIPQEKFDQLKLTLECGHLVNVVLEDKAVTVTGVKDDVFQAHRYINDLMEQLGHYEKTFEIIGPEAKFANLFLEGNISSVLKHVELTDKQMSDELVSYKFKGQKDDVSEALQELQAIRKNIHMTCWNLNEDFKEHELLLLAKIHSSDCQKLEIFDFKEKYLFTFNIPDGIKASADFLMKPNNFLKVNTDKEMSDCIVHISNTCQLVIKSQGNITREKSDVLVSLLGPEHDMRKTAVGKAFNSTIKSHYKDLNACIDANPNASVFTVKNTGSIKCMAICHVVLTRWDNKNIDQSSKQLSDALKVVFNEAKTLGATSISFPVLGCGKAFRFPPSKVSKIFIQSCQDENVESFLQKVVIVAADNELFTALKSDAENSFHAESDSEAVDEDATDQSADETDDEESDDEDITYPVDIKNVNNAQITIFTLSTDIVEKLKADKKKAFKEQFLNVEVFKQKLLNRLPNSLWRKIIQEAINQNVWAEQKQNNETKEVNIHLTGQKDKILQVKNFIQEEFQTITRYQPQRRLISPEAPQRGTVEFMNYAMDSDELFPSYWNLNKNKKFMRKLREGKLYEPEHFDTLVDIDQATKDCITNLVLQTMEPGLIGHGNDAKGISYKSLKVIDVKRVENPFLFDVYRKERQQRFKKMVKMGNVCVSVGNVLGSKGEVATYPFLTDSMKKELYHEINEHYLFHGAKVDTIQTLCNSGLDPRVSNDSCMFGKGIYTAEKSTKADQYADLSTQRVPNGSPLQMFLTRLILGNVFLCDDTHKSVLNKNSIKLSRPPCMNCLEDRCQCSYQLLYDSVLGDGKWLFREFIVYHGNCCYPEYVITYARV